MDSHNKKLAKKVDILIPTHNRPEYLNRILDYYAKYGKFFNIIVTDSSNRNNKQKNKKIVDKYATLNIVYKDKYSENLTQSLKFAETIKLAKNKYCVFCGDDDFIVPNAIYKCVDFLEKNSDYIAAHGTYIGFHVSKYLFGNYFFKWRYRYAPQTISFSNPQKRLDFHLRNYVHLIWAVRRTDPTKLAYKEFLKVKFNPKVLAVMGELFPDCLTVIYGKAKSLNIFYGARQYFGSIIGYYPTLIDAKQDGIYEKEYQKFKNPIVKNLATEINIPKEQLNNLIDAAFDQYNKFSYQEHFMNQVNLFLSHFPKFLAKGLRTLHTVYLFSKPNQSKIIEIDKPVSSNYLDFINIKNQVLENI